MNNITRYAAHDGTTVWGIGDSEDEARLDAASWVSSGVHKRIMSEEGRYASPDEVRAAKHEVASKLTVVVVTEERYNAIAQGASSAEGL